MRWARIPSSFRRYRQHRGVAFVEFTIAGVLLLLIFVAILDFSVVLFHSNKLTHVNAEATRAAAILSRVTTSPNLLTKSAEQAEGYPPCGTGDYSTRTDGQGCTTFLATACSDINAYACESALSSLKSFGFIDGDATSFAGTRSTAKITVVADVIPNLLPVTRPPVGMCYVTIATTASVGCISCRAFAHDTSVQASFTSAIEQRQFCEGLLSKPADGSGPAGECAEFTCP